MAQIISLEQTIAGNMSTVLLALNPTQGQHALLEKAASQLYLPLKLAHLIQDVLDVLNTGTETGLIVCDEEDGERAYSMLQELSVRPPMGHLALVEKMTIAGAVNAGRHGAFAMVDSRITSDELAVTIKSLLQHEGKLSSARAARAKLISRIATLAPTEHEVYRWVLSGVPNKMIAKRLQVSQRTIEARRQKVFRKLDVMSVAELVRLTALYADIESIRAVLPANEPLEYDEAG